MSKLVHDRFDESLQYRDEGCEIQLNLVNTAAC